MTKMCDSGKAELEELEKKIGRFLGYYRKAFESIKKELNIIDIPECNAPVEVPYEYDVRETFCSTVGISEVNLYYCNDSDFKILNSLTEDEIISILRRIMQ